MSQPPQDFATRRRRHEESGVRMGPGVLVCPRCGIPLEGSDHELGIAWRCGACGGQSLNFSQFRRMVPEHGANDIWMQAATEPVTPQQRTLCPECLGGMEAVLIPFRARRVELDICRPCQRLWLDRQEAEAEAESGQSLAMVPAVDKKVSAARGLTLRRSVASVRERAEHMLNSLERRKDRPEDRSWRQRHTTALIRGIVMGAGAFFASWNMPLGLRARLALITAVVTYTMSMLGR